MSGPFGSQQWTYNAGGSFYPYTIDQSLRFDGSTSYLEFTPTVNAATDSSKMTFSTWVKIWGGEGVSDGYILSAGSANVDGVFYPTYDKFAFVRAGAAHVVGNGLRRDPSAWYHVYVTYDADGDGYARLYVNGVLDNETAQTIDLAKLGVQNQLHRIVRKSNAGTYSDLYLAETHFIDGSIVPISTFGETKNGVWVPVETSGITYGNNGWYLDYADTSDIGKDVSGRGNHWTAYGLDAEDVVPDTPTNNFAILNALDSRISEGWKEGGLNWLASSSGYTAHSTMVIPEISDTDTYYAEVRVNFAGYAWGISPATLTGANNSTTRTGMLTVYHNGRRYNGSTAVDGANNGYVTSGVSVGDIFGIKAGNGKLEFFQNGTSLGDAFTSLSGTYKFGCWAVGAAGTGITWNFGQDSTFSGQETAGTTTDINGYGLFNDAEAANNISLCAANTAEPTIGPNSDTQADDYFTTVLSTGDGTNATISGFGFQPDLLWHKARNVANGHWMMDSIRVDGSGDSFPLRVDVVTSAEGSTAAVTLNSDGYVHLNGSSNNFYGSGKTYVDWAWKAGGTASSIAINEYSSGVPSIASSVSANQDAGFSIVSFTGTGANATVGHGLSSAPEMIILKNRIDTVNWLVGSTYNPNGWQNYLNLNGTTDVQSASTIWQDTAPTSSVFYLGSNSATNGTGDATIAYCFHSVEGYSKVGSYTGNGNADGPFIYTGFRPAWVMMKGSNTSGDWFILDATRSAFNEADDRLDADNSNIESTANSDIDFLSNGIKIRTASTAGINQNNDKHIYLAFAENPFKYANAR